MGKKTPATTTTTTTTRTESIRRDGLVDMRTVSAHLTVVRDDDDDDDDDDDAWRGPGVDVIVDNRKQKSSRKLYNRWSDEEKQALILGVEQYGVGQWKLIKEDARFGPILINRSNVDCKDKWRVTTTTVATQRRDAPLSPPLQAIVHSPTHNDRTFQNAINMPHSPMGSPPSHTRGGLPPLRTASPTASPRRISTPDSKGGDGHSTENRKTGCSIM